MENSINIDGIIIPDNSPFFLSLIGIHVLAALICVITAILAMFSAKTGKRHPQAGSFYFWGLLVVFISSILISIIRWPFDNQLLILGTLSFGFAFAGRLAQRNKWKFRMRWHLICMTMSFIILLTAFYVDNGKNIPVWKLLPAICYWLIPGVTGIPIMVYVLLHHPLTAFKTKA
jgi:hypothetical protein